MIARFRKAIAGGLGAGLVYWAQLPDSLTNVAGVTAGQWGGLALAVLVGAGIVAAAPANASKREASSHE